MIVPGLTKASRARVLDVLVRVTQLSEQAVTAAFMDADRGRVAILDPMRAIRKAAYRAAAHGTKGATPTTEVTTGPQAVAAIATAHGVPIDVAGIILGAAFGLRLGLEVRLSRGPHPKRPKLTTKVARHSTKADYDADLAAARAFGRDMDRVARGCTRPKRRL